VLILDKNNKMYYDIEALYLWLVGAWLILTGEK